MAFLYLVVSLLFLFLGVNQAAEIGVEHRVATGWLLTILCLSGVLSPRVVVVKRTLAKALAIPAALFLSVAAAGSLFFGFLIAKNVFNDGVGRVGILDFAMLGSCAILFAWFAILLRTIKEMLSRS